jgi:hypothetical protein
VAKLVYGAGELAKAQADLARGYVEGAETPKPW